MEKNRKLKQTQREHDSPQTQQNCETHQKADVPTYLESDKDLIELQHKINYNKTIVTYLEQVLRSINNRTFTIKNAIEWKKFEAGVI